MAPRSQEPQGFKVTQMSGKSKTTKKEERTKYKYFCTFKLNVKGDKKEIGYNRTMGGDSAANQISKRIVQYDINENILPSSPSS